MITQDTEARDWLATLPQWNDAAAQRLERLVALLREENMRQNLVSAASLDHAWQRHIADSAQLLRHAEGSDGAWLDLGTGSGFPGMVIAALCPEREVVMVESRRKRVDWLNQLKDALGLRHARVEGDRLENVPSQVFSVISARAFAPLDKLLALAGRFSTEDTFWLLPKGRSAQQELADLKGWRHMFHVEQSITDPEAGLIVGRLAGGKGNRA